MPTEMSYKDRLLQLNNWMPDIIETVKKDLKNDHLKKDYAFSKKYFPGKNINKIENQEFADAYTKAIQEEDAAEALAEFIIQRWIFRNSELYHFFEEHLSKINADFTEIKELTSEQSLALESAATEEFGPQRTYIFSYLNGVAFPEAHFKKMEVTASNKRMETVKSESHAAEKQSIEDMKMHHEREIARLTDKYEKKLIGFQKKYTQDIEVLKKQLANVQRKLTAV